jgi:putative ABC transport system permease protein
VSIAGLALKSLRNRRFGAALSVLSIALAVMLVLGVERIRHEVRASFASTVSGTDLIVGARSGPVQLLLYSVFRIGDPTQSIDYATYERLAGHPQVAWSIPLSLGDAHRGYRVLGTTQAYFEHFRYARERRLRFAAGGPFVAPNDAVLGAEVAARLGYRLGAAIVVAHGAGEVSFLEHADKPFRVAGILAPTGTPVDRSIHVSLEGIERLHEDFEKGAVHAASDPLVPRPAPKDDAHGHAPERLSAFLLGLRSRGAAPGMLRLVNEYKEEPLTAIMPAVAMQELWSLVGVAETALRVVSGFVLAVGLMGMLTALLSGLDERRREMAVLRSVGARPVHVFGLILGEAALLTLAGMLLGLVLLAAVQAFAQPLLSAQLGLYIEPAWLSLRELGLLALIAGAGLLIGVIPGARIYRYSLADGMTIRI